MKTSYGVAVAGAAILLMGACSSDDDVDGASSSEREEREVLTTAGTGMDGPWGAEFERGIEKVESAKAEEILSDGKITEEEWSEVQEDFLECGEPLGIEAMKYSPTGGSEIGFSKDISERVREDTDFGDERIEQCEKETGLDVIADLYFRARSNPENEDLRDAIVECLKNEGVVAEDYTVEEYRQKPDPPLIPVEDPERIDAEDGSYILFDEHFIASGCEEDPLGTLGTPEYDWESDLKDAPWLEDGE